VLKAVSAELPHKSEAGAVRVNLQNPAQLREAIAAMRQSVALAAPGIVFDQVIVEPMITDVMTELMVGINTDPQFGQLLVVASGGVLVELIHDVKTLLLPTGEAQIRQALESLKCFRLMQGFRGQPETNVEHVVDTIQSLVDFAATHHATLLELDVNPLMVTVERCIVADVMIRETHD